MFASSKILIPDSNPISKVSGYDEPLISELDHARTTRARHKELVSKVEKKGAEAPIPSSHALVSSKLIPHGAIVAHPYLLAQHTVRAALPHLYSMGGSEGVLHHLPAQVC
jgi:hypothetical protein